MLARGLSVARVRTAPLRAAREPREGAVAACCTVTLGAVVVHESGRGKGCLQRELTLLQEPDLACSLSTR